MFEHDIPGLYAQFVDGLKIKDFELKWNSDLPSFFTHGIECRNVNELFIENFSGAGNPNSPGSQKLKTDNVTFRK